MFVTLLIALITFITGWFCVTESIMLYVLEGKLGDAAVIGIMGVFCLFLCILNTGYLI